MYELALYVYRYCLLLRPSRHSKLLSETQVSNSPSLYLPLVFISSTLKFSSNVHSFHRFYAYGPPQQVGAILQSATHFFILTRKSSAIASLTNRPIGPLHCMIIFLENLLFCPFSSFVFFQCLFRLSIISCFSSGLRKESRSGSSSANMTVNDSILWIT